MVDASTGFSSYNVRKRGVKGKLLPAIQNVADVNKGQSHKTNRMKLLFSRYMMQFRMNRDSFMLVLMIGCFVVLLHIATNQSNNGRDPRGISDLEALGLSLKPRCVEYNIEHAGDVKGDQRIDLPTKDEIMSSERKIDFEGWRQQRLDNSRIYRRTLQEPFIVKDCKQKYDWQISTFLSCNNVHEMDLTGTTDGQLINNGHWRDVWVIEDLSGAKQVLKTLRYEHDYTERNFDRHRRDAVASERLTSSQFVVDIYGFCHNTGIYEYSSGGDLADMMTSKNKLTNLDILRVSIQVARGISDSHNFSKKGQASLAHTDISLGQFILIDGIYKLNDFNRCRFIRWNERENKPCGYTIGKNAGKFRSPEEYNYEEQDEKVDIYSMGNIFYTLLTKEGPFRHIKEKKAIERVKNGDRPVISESIRNSTDHSVSALITAIEMCYIHDPKNRSSAKEVLNYLLSEFHKLTST